MDTITKSPEATQTHIVKLLSDLSPDSLAFVEQLVLFLRERTQPSATLTTREKRAPYLFPTIALPATSLNAWMNLVPKGYDGDALADSEALYDEA